MSDSAAIDTNIKFGNPTQSQLPFLEKGPYQAVYESLKGHPFPDNFSQTVKDEIGQLLSYQNSPTMQNVSKVERFALYDASLVNLFFAYVAEFKDGTDMSKLLLELDAELDYLIYKLKYYYNRPRPGQLAANYKAKLFPSCKNLPLTPSYPSAHTLKARVMTEVISATFTDLYKPLMDITHDISLSRMCLGVNYASDNDFAVVCAKALVTNRDFTAKYQL
jgi:hypothetical protein